MLNTTRTQVVRVQVEYPLVHLYRHILPLRARLQLSRFFRIQEMLKPQVLTSNTPLSR